MRTAAWIFFLIFSPTSALALDTAEPFEPGLSDVEASWTSTSSQFEAAGQIGYGLNRWINPAIGVHRVHFREGKTEMGLSFSNLVNVLEDPLEVDLIPSTDFFPQRTLSLGVEWTKPIGRFTPYFQHSHQYASHSTVEEGDSPLEHEATIGLAYAPQAEFEGLVQLTRTLKRDSDIIPAFGLNIEVSRGVELLTTLALEDETLFQMGFLFTIE